MEARDDVFAASSTAQMSRAVDFVSIKEDGYGTAVSAWEVVRFRAGGDKVLETGTEELSGGEDELSGGEEEIFWLPVCETGEALSRLPA